MGTRSSINLKNEDGTWTSVYCHWDGYLEHNGRMLYDHYNTLERVQELLSHGDISSLRENCDGAEGHSWDTPADGQTVFYHRDRGEDWHNTKPNIYEFSCDVNTEEFNYYYIEGEWFVQFYGESMVTLEFALRQAEMRKNGIAGKSPK